jgi:hypothetical protein
MFMGRKGAMLMLAVVILWAAAPALACLMPADCHSCCHAMDCDSVVMSAAHSCCQVHGSSADVPGVSAIAPGHRAGPQHAMISTVPSLLTGLSGQTPGSAKALPPRSHSGARTILRI